MLNDLSLIQSKYANKCVPSNYIAQNIYLHTNLILKLNQNPLIM